MVLLDNGNNRAWEGLSAARKALKHGVYKAMDGNYHVDAAINFYRVLRVQDWGTMSTIEVLIDTTGDERLWFRWETGRRHVIEIECTIEIKKKRIDIVPQTLRYGDDPSRLFYEQYINWAKVFNVQVEQVERESIPPLARRAMSGYATCGKVFFSWENVCS